MADGGYPGDTQFAGLVEAATAAADQETHWSNSGEAINTEPQTSYEVYGAHNTLDGAHVSSQTGQYNDAYSSESVGVSNRKRKRDTRSTADHHEGPDASDVNSYHPQNPVPRPTIAALSAAAMFRQPLASTKKFTRPPIGKLYSSLELSPENFLHLQSAAKVYMLDEDHPERRDTIGQRGRGDTDLVKLKLWNFVKEFLDDMGNGLRYFGEHVPGVEGHPGRTMFWPQDAEQIIKACVPVLRRMVTNERQRQYALEARKVGNDVQEPQTEDDTRNAQSPTLQSTAHQTMSRTMAVVLEIPDLLNDSCTPGPQEAADWYEDHARQSSFPVGLLLSTLDEGDSRILTANLDGHYRIFHDGKASICTGDCEAQTIERLLLWEKLFTSEDTPEGHVRRAQTRGLMIQLVDYFKGSSLVQGLQGNDKVGLHLERGTADRTLASDSNRSVNTKRQTRSAKTTEARPASSVTTKALAGGLKLQISLVSTPLTATSASVDSVKRLIAPFTVSAASVPNLQILSMKVEEQYGMDLRQLSCLDAGTPERQDTSGSESTRFNVRVWLPDGLVRVRDDGEWTVALLSAEMVEWMDGEVKILVCL